MQTNVIVCGLEGTAFACVAFTFALVGEGIDGYAIHQFLLRHVLQIKTLYFALNKVYFFYLLFAFANKLFNPPPPTMKSGGTIESPTLLLEERNQTPHILINRPQRPQHTHQYKYYSVVEIHTFA